MIATRTLVSILLTFTLALFGACQSTSQTEPEPLPVDELTQTASRIQSSITQVRNRIRQDAQRIQPGPAHQGETGLASLTESERQTYDRLVLSYEVYEGSLRNLEDEIGGVMYGVSKLRTVDLETADRAKLDEEIAAYSQRFYKIEATLKQLEDGYPMTVKDLERFEKTQPDWRQ